MGPRFSVLKLSKSILAVAVLGATTALAEAPSAHQWKLACAQSKCTATPVSQPSPGFNLLVYKIDETPVIEIITPLGINLQTGIGLFVDQTKSFPTKLLTCELDGCRAFSQLTPPLLTALKRGLLLEIIVQTSKSRETLAFEFSLDGFTKAFEGI